ncbi:TIGR03084 family metal-binding protein [Aeromicrobium sp. P5_D10]
MTILDGVLTDLAAESAQLDEWVGGLTTAEWATVTTAEGWTVAHQIAHLHWTDIASIAAIRTPDVFGQLLTEATSDPTGYVDAKSEEMALLPVADLLAAWREGRSELDKALRDVPDGEKIAWFGPPMSPTSMATARIMETWAHGHDVAEALGLAVLPSSRARHVCHIGVRARGFAYLVHGEQDPGVDIRVELTGPGGELWTWGAEDASDRVTGSAHDFALLATRRRHLDDVDVSAQGQVASHWLTIIQAFAGLPGADPVRLADRSAGE